MSKFAYPIIIYPAENGSRYVDIPDLHIGTQGSSIVDCIEMARDAIGLWGICQQDENKPIPEPSANITATNDGELVTYVDVDFDAYRRANDMRSVRKNVTLPSWLCDMAEKANVNFSQVLQEALKTKLGA